MEEYLIAKLIAGGALLIIGLALLGFYFRRQENVRLLFALLFIGLSAGIFIYLIFPDSQTSGKWLVFELAGPPAFVVLVWLFFHKKLKTANNLDECKRTVAHLKKQLSLEESPHIKARKKIAYQIGRRPEVTIGIAAGDIRDFKDMDVWVNSENQHMLMARFLDASVSGIIRYEGAKKGKGGRIEEDLIADELTRKTQAYTPVEIGSVFVTSSGDLAQSHHASKVKKIIHVAAVSGRPGKGYQVEKQHTRFVRGVLGEVMKLNKSGEKLQSVLLPLFGTGTAKHDAREIMDEMLLEVLRYMKEEAETPLQEVWFLVYKKQEKTWLEETIAGCSELKLQKS